MGMTASPPSTTARKNGKWKPAIRCAVTKATNPGDLPARRAKAAGGEHVRREDARRRQRRRRAPHDPRQPLQRNEQSDRDHDLDDLTGMTKVPEEHSVEQPAEDRRDDGDDQ